MAIDFPNSPTNGQTHTVGDTVWTYDGSKWNKNAVTVEGPPGFIAQTSAPFNTGLLWLDTDEPASPVISPTIVDFKGDLLVGSAADTVVRQGVGSDGDMFFADSTATNGVRWQGQEVAGRNKIINGNMMVAQRGTSFTSTRDANDDSKYNLDRWYVLSDGNDVVDITQSTDAPTNGLNSIALDVETVNKKFGIAQIIEQKNCIGLIGETVTLSFMAKVSSTTKLDNVKAAIISWSGTADALTSTVSTRDVVSAWNVEGTNPTLIANATYENTPANLNVTTSWARYSITAAVDTASTKNIIVFIWSDVTDTTLGDFLYVTDVQLEYGSVATRFTMHGGGFEGELAACQRYYYRWQASAAGNSFGNGFCDSATVALITFFLPTVMRASPTALETTGTAGDYSVRITGFTSVNTSQVPSFANATTFTTVVSLTVTTGLTGGQAPQGRAVNANAYLGWSAEL